MVVKNFNFYNLVKAEDIAEMETADFTQDFILDDGLSLQVIFFCTHGVCGSTNVTDGVTVWFERPQYDAEHGKFYEIRDGYLSIGVEQHAD